MTTSGRSALTRSLIVERAFVFPCVSVKARIFIVFSSRFVSILSLSSAERGLMFAGHRPDHAGAARNSSFSWKHQDLSVSDDDNFGRASVDPPGADERHAKATMLPSKYLNRPVVMKTFQQGRR